MFSVIIPLYNKELHIARALNSVLGQTCQDFEIIIVDDGSTDTGPSLVADYPDPRITLIRQQNMGVSSARNRGIEQAIGDLLAFLDADDEWRPKHLETIWQLALSYPTAGIYATSYQLYEHNRSLSPGFKAIPDAPWQGIIPSYFKSAALGAPPVCSSTACIPRPIIHQVGGFLAGQRMGEDLEMWGRIALQFPVAFSWEIGATYFHDSSNRACLIFQNESGNPFIKTACHALENSEYGDCVKDDLRKYLAKLKLIDAKRAVIAGEFVTASEIMDQLEIRDVGPYKLLLSKPMSFMTRYVWNVLILGKLFLRYARRKISNNVRK